MSFDSLNISASGLYAQRIKMDAIASNIANVNTTRNPDGTPGVYKKKEVVFSAIYNDAMNPNKGKSSDGISDINMELDANSGTSNNAANIATGVSVNQIVEDNNPPRQIYNPTHPDADKDGFVSMPNINIVTEMVDMIAASRAYEANITTLDTAKNMLSSALRI
ncbi:MAG: flagellar basal body rod protein FlgC [Candidatus Melainabacteria bacterium RIFOXYA12_FULL_32_12]|nr:MAG: flagellar basal body rod protein FlgC [Candidatus Melainabacteria bacterium GWF2_32_7]OGI23042.1 MAG: flagellar basal body rod protein FlgC [Candidatus Melainabacteria bacterium RIFOXYA2_FULL_32_9]OGI31372.1 MAG: flagellar basal body rod protein FlgC [Candidatus Melainabacteria bacterium RIFOXYA12_FULL_32_12]